MTELSVKMAQLLVKILMMSDDVRRMRQVAQCTLRSCDVQFSSTALFSSHKWQFHLKYVATDVNELVRLTAFD